MISPNKKNSLLGFIAGWVARPKRSVTVDRQDMQKLEFKTSAQRMGISFTDKLRDAFRHRWLKKH